MQTLNHNTLGLQILTPSGWQNFEGVACMGQKEIVSITISDRSLDCSKNHYLLRSGHELVPASEIVEGDKIYTEFGLESVLSVSIASNEVTYSPVEVDNGSLYYSNGVVSKNCNFVTDDLTLINPLCLVRMQSSEPEFYTGTVRWFKMPEPNKTYMVGLDPSIGSGSDFAAIQVFELPGMIQVAEWQHNMSVAKIQVKVLLQILHFIDGTMRDHIDQRGDPELYWTVENNTIGEHVLQIIEDTGEERFPGTFISEKKKKGSTRRFRKGLNTDNKKKLSACARFKSLVESDRAQMNSRQLIRQLKAFVGTEGGITYKAKPGEHDDLVMAAMLCVRMLDMVSLWGLGELGDFNEYIGEQELFEQMPMPVLL